MSRKREMIHRTGYHEIVLFQGESSVPSKQLQSDIVMVDSKAFYVGRNGNWKYSWKTVENVEFVGRNRLTVKSKSTTIECHGNDDNSQNFQAFRDNMLKVWRKKQSRQEVKAAMEAESTRGPTKKRRSYGRRPSLSNPRISMAQTMYYSSDDDEQEKTTPWKEPEEEEAMQESPVDEGEIEFNDGESPAFYDDADDTENQSSNVNIKTKKHKGRLKKKSFDDGNDSGDDVFGDTDAITPALKEKRTLDDDDEDLFGDPKVTTPTTNRLVSPPNAESDDKENKPVTAPQSSAKGTQSIKAFFMPASAVNANDKKTVVAESPPRRTSPYTKPHTPIAPTKPLTQDNEWLTTRTPKAISPRRSKYFSTAPKLPKDDEDVESPPTKTSQLPMDLQQMISSGYKGSTAQEEVGDIQGTPPCFPTSGDSRKRWAPRALQRRRPMTPHGRSPKRSSADAVLDYVYTPKRLRLVKSNPYLTEKKSNVTVQETPRASSPWRGLRNLGNTCYLNSSLQMLFSVPSFVSSLVGKGKDLSKSIVSVSNDIKDASAIHSANPKTVKKALDAVTDKFQGYEQRDAHEFLSDLIDRVHDELEEERKESRAETTADATEENAEGGAEASSVATEENAQQGNEAVEDTNPLPTDEYFRMNVQVCLTCDSCGYARTMEEMYRHLSIDIEDEHGPLVEGATNSLPWTVQRGIDQFFAPEKREIRCEKCTDGTTATQTLRILSRPKVLLLHLKRFVLVEKVVNLTDGKENADKNTEEPKPAPAVEMAIRKNKAPIILNPSISIGPIVSSDAKKENDKDRPMATYDVKSIVHHIGSTAWSGHYTCDAPRESDSNKSPSNDSSAETWVSFDDGKTSLTTADGVLNSEMSQKTAYMLLYTLHDEK